jgi:hypothetical protein
VVYPLTNVLIDALPEESKRKLRREGVPQGLHLLGEMPVPTGCFMKIGGTGLRIEFEVLRRLFLADEALRGILLAYAQYQSLMLGQVAGRGRRHFPFTLSRYVSPFGRLAMQSLTGLLTQVDLFS